MQSISSFLRKLTACIVYPLVFVAPFSLVFCCTSVYVQNPLKNSIPPIPFFFLESLKTDKFLNTCLFFCLLTFETTKLLYKRLIFYVAFFEWSSTIPGQLNIPNSSMHKYSYFSHHLRNNTHQLLIISSNSPVCVEFI